ncbi:MAG: LPS assembly lipoprotein LptE [Woeseiaceae bacterium]|nr:LPS assembly lipoprotein LptE [Woeseiaceae bacterium]
MTRTYIDTDDRHSLFYRRLRRELQAAGVDVVESAANASAVFSILSDQTDQRVLSVSARNVPREYEVYYSVYYGVSSGQAVLLPPQEQVVTRDYTYDETRVLGKAREEELLREAIADDLVRIVLIQLSAL